MPAFEILMELKLRILIGLVIESLIITITKVYIRVHTYSLIRGLTSANCWGAKILEAS